MLAVEPSEVDALAVLRDTVTASQLLDAGDDRGAAELSASTLELYRGDVLPAAGDGDWVTPHRARLDEARMKLVEIQFSARLRLGDVGDVIGELEAAVATYPYQEGLWELLITALYRAGRQADALATYQRVRTLLADELGLDPGPRLQQLEQQILNHDPALARAPSAAAAGNLPSMSAELVGRETEIAALSELLASASGSSRSSGRAGSGRRPSRSRPVDADRVEPCGARWHLVGQARNRDDGGRRPRHGDRRVERHGRRGGAVRAAQGRRRGGDPRQLRARRRRGRGARGPPPRRRPRAADPVHQPGPARRRRRGRVRARTPCARRRRRAVHPSCRRPAREPPSARPTTRCATCAARSTGCRWRSSSRRHVPGRCRSRRSPAASTIASAC